MVQPCIPHEDFLSLQNRLKKFQYMKNKSLHLISLFLASAATLSVTAQTYSSSSNLTAQPTADRVVPFRLSEPGIVRDVQWGADEAWMHEQNLRRCVLFMGKDNVEVVRVSFQPTYPLVDGDLQQEQKDDLEERLRLLGFCSPDVQLTLNCDHPSVDSWYQMNAERWAQLIDVTARYFEEAGYEIISVAPFNEPDYGWNQWVPGSQDGLGSLRQSGFGQVAAELRKNSHFDTIRICGGNTLNCDEALPWFNALSEYLDEGNTHQLAGSFDNFAAFFTAVREAGKHATADEMHNVMEAMVGLEYGMQTGIWWGPAEYARGEFCKASHGERLAYAEHRDNWTAASVYRAPDGKVQAFGGTSERQAVTTTYRFLSKDCDVFFNGYGPQREYVMELPGGTGYQQGQTNAEQVVNITWGEDIQPVINGTYILVNKDRKNLLEIADGTVKVGTYSRNSPTQQWKVTPLDARSGGDFSYFSILSVGTGQALDVLDWSLEDSASVIAYTNSNSANQQWYLEYAGDNWFRIRNRHSSLCLQASYSTVTQGTPDDSDNQLWRLLPTNVRPRYPEVDAPAGLTAEGRASSIRLKWNKVSASVPTYTVLRAEQADGPYNTIARNVDDTVFVDNKTLDGHTYYYKVKAVDQSLNTSEASANIAASTSGEANLLARYEFEGNTNDTTYNLNHGATPSAATYVEGKSGTYALHLDGTGTFVQLPTTIAHRNQLTIATWVYWRGGSDWQRIFDFGNGEDEYMFLTARNDNRQMRFAIKNGGEEQQLNTDFLPRNEWVHIALTMDDQSVCLYQNGELVASSADITLRPSDFSPVLNYIGRSQFTADPLFNGDIDDMRIYNHALDNEEIKALIENTTSVTTVSDDERNSLNIGPSPADRQLNIMFETGGNPCDMQLTVHNLQGTVILSTTGKTDTTNTIDTSALPDGMYILQVVQSGRSISKKFIVHHP